jgi:nitroreductase
MNKGSDAMLADVLKPEVALIRKNEHQILNLILNRWSPRAFTEELVTDQDVIALLEAARWAPSCFNEQPWRFIVARTPENLEKLRNCLSLSNQLWTKPAPILMALLGKPHFELDQAPNRWNGFDAGAAWGYLALEATRRGLIAHAMGGFSQKKIHEAFQVPDGWTIYAVIAIGHQGPKEILSPELQAREIPSQRQALEKIWTDGSFSF